MKKSLSEIEKRLRQHKDELMKKYRLKSIAIFGSYGRQGQNERSDVDILIDYEQQMGIEFIDLAIELEAILKLKVDLVSKKGVKTRYLNSIEQELVYV